MLIERVFLIGFMGSGKSTLGRRLKSEMGWDFIDLDDYFESIYKTTIKQYFAEFGEAAFRQAERKMLNEVVKWQKVIIATGGGTPCYFDNMELMNDNGLTIYIKLPVKTLAGRLSGPKQVRPLVAGMSGERLLQFIDEKLREREPFYNRAKIVVDAEVMNAEAFKRVIEASGNLID